MITVAKELSKLDEQWIERLVIGGPEALVEIGLSLTQVKDFMERPEVKAKLESINTEFNHQDVVTSLTKFATRRKLARMIPDSLDVLRNALAGPVYAQEEVVDTAGNEFTVVRHDIQGNPIIRIPEPTRNQLKAAAEVLDRTGVVSVNKNERLPSMNINLLLKQEQISDIQIEMDPELTTSEQQSLSREKVRNVIEKLSKGLNKVVTGEKVKELKSTLTGKKPKKKAKKAEPTPKKSKKTLAPKKKTVSKSNKKVAKKIAKKAIEPPTPAPKLKKVVRAKKAKK